MKVSLLAVQTIDPGIDRLVRLAQTPICGPPNLCGDHEPGDDVILS